MYKLQFVNVLTKEVCRDVIYSSNDDIKEIIEIFDSNKEIEDYIVDSNRRLLKMEYISYTIFKDEEFIVYRLFFKMKLAKIQLNLNNYFH